MYKGEGAPVRYDKLSSMPIPAPRFVVTDDRHSVCQACAGLVLDCGFSFTHAIPIFDGHVIPCGIRRVNVGGKVITNLLKEVRKTDNPCLCYYHGSRPALR